MHDMERTAVLGHVTGKIPLMSDFSALHPAKPGLGDKMFEGVSGHGPYVVDFSISA